jgi:CRISPR-associated exonuclease Cas4
MIRISDIKQYIYCPRVIFYHHCLMVDKKKTYKMEHGSSEHEIIELLENRRKLKSYGLSEGKKEFEKFIQSDTLSGRLDLLISTEKDGFKYYYPVDYKHTKSVQANHIYQIVGYALLLEQVYETNVDTGFIYLIPAKKIEKIDVTNDLKIKCKNIIKEIDKILQSDVLPEPTDYRSRCIDCEFNRFCDDIW